MLKRRELTENDSVIIIYHHQLGFIKQASQFKQYRSIIYNSINHQIPVFDFNESEITGLECFWLLLSDIEYDESRIEDIQRELIGLQITASEIGAVKGYKIPRKIQDKEIDKMVTETAEHRKSLIKELGYDPLDYSWVEREMSRNDTERNWFQFLRENKGGVDENWQQWANTFNDKFRENVSSEQAFHMSRKWKRYIIGAWNTITSKNGNIEDWKKAATEFEKYHREIEERMLEWSLEHQSKFPLAKVKKPLHFRHGPYFNECVERVPKLFTSTNCYELRPDVVLRVVAYDSVHKFIRLDFTSDVRALIKPSASEDEIWKQTEADYVIYCSPNQIDSHLELIGSLE